MKTLITITIFSLIFLASCGSDDGDGPGSSASYNEWCQNNPNCNNNGGGGTAPSVCPYPLDQQHDNEGNWLCREDVTHLFNVKVKRWDNAPNFPSPIGNATVPHNQYYEITFESSSLKGEYATVEVLLSPWAGFYRRFFRPAAHVAPGQEYYGYDIGSYNSNSGRGSGYPLEWTYENAHVDVFLMHQGIVECTLVAIQIDTTNPLPQNEDDQNDPEDVHERAEFTFTAWKNPFGDCSSL